MERVEYQRRCRCAMNRRFSCGHRSVKKVAYRAENDSYGTLYFERARDAKTYERSGAVSGIYARAAFLI